MVLDETRLFVGGLPQTATDHSVLQHFATYGAIEACVNMDKATGRSKGFAFVHFEDPHGVQAALMEEHALDGKLVECKPCLAKGASPAPTPRPLSSLVGPFVVPVPATNLCVPASGAAPTHHKLFVGGLSQATTNESMDAHFKRFGPCECVVMQDQVTGRSRGFGFAVFQRASQAAAALGNRGGATHMIDGKHVDCKACEEARPRDAELSWPAAQLPVDPPVRPAGRPLSFTFGSAGHGAASDVEAHRIFVGGLPQSCDDEALVEFASQFGEVIESKVHMDVATGRSKGFGYVSFADPGSCEVAVSNSPHNFIDDKWVDVKQCEAKTGRGGKDHEANGFNPPVANATKGGNDRRTFGKAITAGATNSPRLCHDNSRAIQRTAEVLKVVGPDEAEQIADIVELMEDIGNLQLVQNLLSAVGSADASAVKSLGRKCAGRLGPY